MNKKTMKKSLAGFMVVAVLSGTLAPAALIFAADETRGDNGLVLEKLKTEQSEKSEQLRDFDSEEKMKTFSVDEGLKKLSEIKQLEKQNYVEGEVLVKFKEQKINLEQSDGRTKAMQFATDKNLDKKEDIRKSNISVLKTKGDESVEGMVERLKSDPNVEYVEPNYKRYPTVINTNDTYKDLLWGLDNVNDKDIDAPEAWEISEGSENNVIVAVIDTGVAYNHPDLIANMWSGIDCKDDSGGTLGGCNYGYDYEDNDKFPLDNNGHGTHIAGTIGTVKNNGIGIIGVAPNVKIMALKFGFDTISEIKAINFAIQNGAKIINASYVGSTFSSSEYNAINDFKLSGGIFVAAAGNGGADGVGDSNDSNPQYPADYDLDNIISVAATDQNDDLASFSNYGINSVDVGAPGVNIYSTYFTSEKFTNAELPNFTNTLFTKTSGNWKTGTWDGVDKMAAANSSYVNSDDGVLTLTTPLNTAIYNQDVYLKFYLAANIEPPIGSSCYDYILVEVDNNDDNWEIKAVGCGNLGSQYQIVNIGPGKSNMRIRFNWHTDSSITGSQVPLIDDIQISNTHSYIYASGTSMAAPHVAGLAALIWGYDSELSYSEVKNVILTTGDDLPNADDRAKIVTGKRINAHKALSELVDSSLEATRNDSFGDQNVMVGATEVKVGSAIITAGDIEGVNVTSINIDLSSDEAASITNLKLKDDQGSQLGDVEISPLESNTFLVGYEIPVSESKIIDLYTDINSDADTGLWNADFMAEGAGLLTSNSVSSSSVELQNMNLMATTLTASKNDGFEDQDIIVGSTNVKVGSAVFSASEAEDINVTSVTINLSDTEAASISSLILKDDGGVQLADTKTIPSTSNSFLINLTVPADYSKIIDLYADINSDATLGLWSADLEAEGVGIASATSVSVSSVTLQVMNLIEAPFINTPPVMESITLDPNPAYTNDDIIATAAASDSDDDTVTFSYQWKKSVGIGYDFEDITGETDATLSSDNFVKGNIIKVEVTPNDETDDGDPMESDPITISNSDPTQPTVSISPNPAYTDDDLTCNPSGSTDADAGDNPVSYVYQWYKDGVAQEGYTSNAVLASQTTADDVWKCEVVADDGEAQSATGEDSVTILETIDTTPPVIAEIVPVPNSTNDNTPEYTFTSTEWGTITHSGGCSSATDIALEGNNTITFNTLADGTYGGCTIMVTDASNNDSNVLEVSDFTVDTTDPTAEETIAVTTPTSDTTPDVGITVEDGASWEIKNGDDILEAGVGNGMEQIITLSGLGEGTYNLSLVATDEAGNTTTVNLSEFTIDLSASPISLSNLPNNPTNETTTDIIVSGDDLVFYKYELDGAGYGVEIAIDTNIVLSGLSEGNHTISVIGRDEVGNWSAEISETWTIDLTAPDSPVIIDPAGAIILNADTYSITGTAEDNSLVGIYSGIELIGSQQLGIGETAYSIEVNLTQNADNNFTATATDLAGNESVSATVPTITEDSIAPVVIITSPADGFITNLSNITIEYTVDETLNDNTENLSEGTNTVTRSETDGAGNIGSDSITVILDTTPPVRSDGLPTGTLVAGTTQTTLSLVTDENAICKYGTLASVPYDEIANTFSSTDSTTHSQTITGLTNGNSYTYYIRCQDDSDNSNADDYTISFSVSSPSTGGGGGGGGSSYSHKVSSHNRYLRMLSTQEGTLTQDLNNENKVKVEIPKGSIKSTTTFTASEGSLEEGDIPKEKIGAFLFNGLVFNVEAVDLSGKAVRDFSEDLTITLTIPDLPDDISTLELYYFDDENNKWIIITGIVFGKNMITFKVNHLTQFAVFETNATKIGTSSAPEVKGITTTEILDGDIIQCQSSDNPFAVYIVKVVGDTKYIRHIVSLDIFNYYGHLQWENLKQVESLNEYSLSGWVRYNTGLNYTAAPTNKVYEINGDQTKHWINMTAEQFLSHGGSEPAIFNINQGELNLYTAGADVMSL